MKFNMICTLAALALVLSACGGGNKQQEDETERIVEEVNENTGVANLISYDDAQTVTVNGKEYTYSYEFYPVDSLPHIINSQGIEYLDNVATLTIRRDSTVVTRKQFLKSSFKSYVPQEIWDQSGLVGFAYNYVRQQKDAFYFIATIGDPDETSEISYPLEIRITTDGGMTISKASGIDTAPLHDGMTIDPED